MKKVFILTACLILGGCATLTEDAMTPIAMSFSDGSRGNCELTNKRGAWSAAMPTTVSIRKSDDALKYRCETVDGRVAVGAIESEMGAKIVASAVFLDLGITDAITDKHRMYAGSFVVPVEPLEGSGNQSNSVASELEKLNQLRIQGVITDAEFDAEKRKLLQAN